MREIVLIICCIVVILLPICFVLYARSIEVYPIQSKNKKYKIQDEMNMLNDTIWIKKVIKSCKTYKQLIHANRLRYILKDKYKNKVDSELLDKVYNDLYLHWDVMKHQIIHA